MRFIVLRGFAISLGLALALVAEAQEHPALERGFAVDKLYHFASAELDQVDLFSGALIVRIPIGGHEYPIGGGLGYRLALVYSSKFWDFEEGQSSPGNTWIRSVPGRHANAGLGWTLSLGRLIPPGDPSNETNRWQYQGPDASRHGFFPVLHPADAAEAGVSYTRDSTYLRMTELAAGKRQVEFSDGTFHTFGADGTIERIENRFGAYLDITYPDGSTWQLSDQHGRTHTVRFKTVLSDGAAVQVVDQVELAAFGGTTATYTFEYQTASIHPACTDTFHNLPGATIDITQLDRVVLPDSTAYTMGYQLDSCGDGVLTSVELPTLGRIEYGYTPWQLPTEGCNLGGVTLWAQSSPGVVRRALVDASGTEVGVWTYDQQLQGPPSPPTGLCGGDDDPPELSVTTVTTPLGDRSVHYFSVWPNALPLGGSPNGFRVEEYGLPINRMVTDATGTRYLSSEIYDCEGGSCDDDKVRSIYVRYEYEEPCLEPETMRCQDSNRRVASQRTVYHDDFDMNGVEKYADVTFSDHDGVGNYRTRRTGGNFPAGNVRTTFTNYNPGHDLVLGANNVVQPGYVMWPSGEPWVLDTYTETSVTEGSATARTQACFDAETGFLERERILIGATPHKDDVIVLYTADGDGNLQSEAYFGGDTQNVGTSSNLCGLTLPSAQYRMAHTYSNGSLATSRYTDAAGNGIGFVSLNLTIDPSTGLPSASEDPSGLVTTYEYDEMGRLEWEMPESGHGAWAQLVYHDATSATNLARVQSLRRANGSKTGAILSQEDVRFDAFGRVWKERRLMPAGVEWVMRETLYDAQGQKTQVAEWAQVNASPFVQHWTEHLDYDAFGRPKTIRPPDGPAHDVKMIYTGDRVVRRKVKIATSRNAQGVLSETESETKERYDRQGRLHQVVEPSGAGGTDVTTTYTHDVGNRLSRVRTSSGGVTQTRTFTYDHRGNLVSETHPEKDGVVTYSDYDARGHAGRKVDGGHDLTLSYDLAERLTAITETGGSQRPLKTFAYATTVAANNWKKGKLETATRYNYYGGVEYPEPPSPPGQIFADGFECGDLSAWDGGSGCPPEPIDAVVVAETYTYGGVGGRVSQRDVALTLNGASAGTFTQGWTYTDLGQVAGVTYPRCTFTECTSDGAGTIRAVSHGYARSYPTSVTGYASITYHPNNLVHTVAHTNGVTDTQAIDPNGMARPASITATRETATGTTIHWASGTYGYDGAGNITEIGRAYYLYDPVNRLTTGAFPTDRLGTGALVEQTYVYDIFGNIQSIGGTSGRMTPTDSSTNRLQGTAVYDAAGNLTHWNGNDYAYDAFNMMTRMTAGAEDWLYVYTADDERVWQLKLTAGTPFHRLALRDLSGKVLREYSSTDEFWVVERDYVYRGGLLLAAEAPDGERHFHLDHLGTPRAITNGSGVREAFHVYYPFGEEATDPSQDQERMKFTGHERDLADPSGTGDDLDYMHARFCLPLAGRFLTVDPVKSFNVTLPQSWNMYTYVRNSPLSYTDPTGQILNLASLNSEQQEQLLTGLEQFTGNTYSIDSGNLLQLDATSDDSSPLATDLINELINSEREFTVVESPDGKSRGLNDTGEIQINFSSFENVDYGSVDPRTFNLGSTFVHESIHASTTLQDLVDGVVRLSFDWTGPVVDIVNRIRSERGLPTRASYLAEPLRRRRSRLPFVNVDPKRPDRRFYVRRQRFDR